MGGAIYSVVVTLLLLASHSARLTGADVLVIRHPSRARLTCAPHWQPCGLPVPYILPLEQKSSSLSGERSRDYYGLSLVDLSSLGDGASGNFFSPFFILFKELHIMGCLLLPPLEYYGLAKSARAGGGGRRHDNEVAKGVGTRARKRGRRERACDGARRMHV